MNLHDIIADMSEKQKAIRVEKLSAELAALGYSVVLDAVLAKLVEDASNFAKEHRA